jgi:type I restriction enzyme S subunit
MKKAPWTTIKLEEVSGDVGIFVDGDWVESKDQDPKGNTRLTQLADIGVGEFLDRSSRFLTSEKAKELKCTFLKEGDILVARMPDPIGRACIFPGDKHPCVTVVDVCIIRPNPREICNRWLMWMINSPQFKRQLDQYISGTTRQRISRKNLQKLKIPLPPLEEQRRIAAILDKADGVRRKRKEAIRLTEELLKSTFLEMFGDPVTNPKGWEVESLGDLVEFRTGKLDSNAAVENGRYPFFTCSRVPFSIDEYAFDCEALLLAGNNASADYWVKHYKGKFNAYQRTYILNLKNERISYFYMQKALDLRLNELKQSSRGTNTKYLTLTILKPIKIQLPNIEVQDKYEAFCRSQETQRGRLTQAFEQSENLFNSLLQRAFRGEL